MLRLSILMPLWLCVDAQFSNFALQSFDIFARSVASGDILPMREPLISARQDRSKFLNERTQPFSVDGTKLPEVDFDVGESYAGLLPIGDANDGSDLFFWFFPSENPGAEKEILIWLTGGPGCSSIGELLQQNGPFLWPPGTFKPVKNQWSWNRLTNVVWIDQPVGTGFSRGTVTARNELDVGRQFMGFWRNFADLFAMQDYKVYVTGASYGGLYVPYVANEMLSSTGTNTSEVDVGGMLIFDALYGKTALGQDIPSAAFVEKWAQVLNFNETFANQVQNAAEGCGYTRYLDEFLVFPPSGVQPSDLPGHENGILLPECALLNTIFNGALEINPCFSVYSVLDKCPRRFDPLGFSGGTGFIPEGAGPPYFDREDVKAVIHAPEGITWEFCSSDPVFINGIDESLDAGPAAQPVLPRVIEATNNVILGHGAFDVVLAEAGTLLALQNMTWGGTMGFQTAPQDPLFIPFHESTGFDDQAGAGTAGIWHEERGLTYFRVNGAGHFLSQDAPAVAYRAVEVLLGRVENLGSDAVFTTDERTGVAESGVGAVGRPTGEALGALGGATASAGVVWLLGGSTVLAMLPVFLVLVF